MPDRGWPTPPNYHEVPEQPWKVSLEEPSFPVVYPEPTMYQAMSNMRWERWIFIAGAGLLGATIGYKTGSRTGYQRPNMWFGTALLGKTGLLFSIQDAGYRLMGMRENGREIAGCLPNLMRAEQYN